MPTINTQKALDIEPIANGFIIRESGQKPMYFQDIEEITGFLTGDLIQQVKDAQHHEGLVKFTLKLTAYDAAPEVTCAPTPR